MEKQDLKDLQVIMVPLVIQDLTDILDQPENKALEEKMAILAKLALRVRLVLLVPPALLVIPVRLVTTGRQDPKVTKERLDPQAFLGLQEKQAYMDQLVKMVKLVQLVKPVPQDPRVLMVPQDMQELLVKQVLQVPMETQATMELLVQLDLKDRRLLDLLAPLVFPGLPDSTVLQEKMLWDLQARRVRKVLKEIPVLHMLGNFPMVQLVQLVLLLTRVQPVLRVPMVNHPLASKSTLTVRFNHMGRASTQKKKVPPVLSPQLEVILRLLVPPVRQQLVVEKNASKVVGEEVTVFQSMATWIPISQATPRRWVGKETAVQDQFVFMLSAAQ
jgi:hypothetical protein